MIYPTRLLLAIATLLAMACTAPTTRQDLSHERQAAVINVQLGIAYLNKGNLKIAKQKLERALSQEPDLALAHWSYALLLQRLGSHEAAEKHFLKSIELDPQDSKARNNYGRLLCSEGRLDEAFRQFKAAVENPLYDDPGSAYTNAGICALRKPDVRLAESQFRMALKADPIQSRALYQMAKLTFGKGHFLQSRAFIQRYERSAAHTPGSLWLAYQTERNLENPQQARKYGQHLKQQYPESRETTNLLELEHDS